MGLDFSSPGIERQFKEIYMSIPVEYRWEKYFITDEKTMEKYNCFFAGFIWLGSSRYKKYLTADKKILVEV